MDRVPVTPAPGGVVGYGMWLASMAASLGSSCDGPGDVDKVPVILWQVPSQRATTAPLVLPSVVVFGALDGSVIAFDRQTGATRWKQQLALGEVYGTAVKEAGGLAIVPQYEVWALEPSTGAIRWSFGGPDGAAGVHDVATAGDTVFTGSADGWASAVDAKTGHAYWSVDLAESPWRPAVTADLVIYGTRGFLGENRQGPLGAGHVIALRRSDGSEVWRFALPDSAGIFGGAVHGGAVWQDRVIVGGVIGRAYALRLSDGALLWQQANDPHVVSYSLPPAILDDLVVFSRWDNVVEGRHVSTGAQLWTAERPTGTTPPIVVGRYVYVIDGSITMTTADGTVVWKYGGVTFPGPSTSFFRGSVSNDGIIYTLGRTYLTPNEATFVFALRPPVRP